MTTHGPEVTLKCNAMDVGQSLVLGDGAQLSLGESAALKIGGGPGQFPVPVVIIGNRCKVTLADSVAVDLPPQKTAHLGQNVQDKSQYKVSGKDYHFKQSVTLPLPEELAELAELEQPVAIGPSSIINHLSRRCSTPDPFHTAPTCPRRLIRKFYTKFEKPKKVEQASVLASWRCK